MINKGSGIMKINELNADSRKVDVTGSIASKEEPREINTRYGKTMISNAVLEDDSGSITLVLWGDECSKVNEKDKIKIENGYVKEWNGNLQLSVGKYGKMTVLE